MFTIGLLSLYIFGGGSELTMYKTIKLWGKCPKIKTVALPTWAFKQGMFDKFKHIPAACMTVMEKPFMHGINAG
jgi:hypothetical protein